MTETFFADFHLYSFMAHFVGKVLHIRPNEIMSTWGIPELIVAYGQYANETTYKNYKEWESLDRETKRGIDRPEQWAVRFYSFDKLNEDGE